MPFKSKAQEKFLFANKPKMAKQWAKETPSQSDLPEKIAKSNRPPQGLVSLPVKP